MAWTASPFPPLSLSPEEKIELIRTGDSLVDEAIDTYLPFLENGAVAPASTQWKQVREHEAFRVFHNTQTKRGADDEKLQQLMAIGAVEGSFGDVTFGFLNHSTEDMRVRSVYLGDTFLDGAVLETILAPSPEQPFRSTTVRWCVKGVPFFVRAVAKHRDSVFLQATGTRKLPSGDIIGYDLLQAVDHINAPRLPQYERSQISICALWMPVGPNRVRIVTRSYWILEDNFFLSAKIKSFADAMVSIGRVVKCGQRKKLAWFVQNRKCISMELERLSANAWGCTVCGDELSESRRNFKHTCAVCSKPTCKKCRVKLNCAYIAAHGEFMELRTRFCLACASTANATDAAVVARDEAARAMTRERMLQVPLLE